MYGKCKAWIQTHSSFLLCFLGVIFILFVGGCIHSHINKQGTVERIEEQQQNSVRLNQELRESNVRTQNTLRETERTVERIETTQRAIEERINTAGGSVERARTALERNERIFKEVEEQQ